MHTVYFTHHYSWCLVCLCISHLFIFCPTRWVQGFTSSNTAFLDEKTSCYSCGNFIIFINVETARRKVLQSPGHGIGVFTASGFNKMLAFSEQKRFPSVFVYRYPELSLRCELKGVLRVSSSFWKALSFVLWFNCFAFIFQAQLNWLTQPWHWVTLLHI